MFLISLLALAQTLPPIEDSPRWVVREFMPVDRLNLGFPVDWRTIAPTFSDADRNGCTDLILSGDHHISGSSRRDTVVTTSLGGSTNLSEPWIFDWRGGDPYKYHYGSAVLLNSGSGLTVLGMDIGNVPLGNQESFLLFWDPQTFQVLKRLPRPTPPGPGYPELTRWGYGHTPGDMDGDGYDDFATIVQDDSYNWLTALVVDGRTRSYRWVRYIPERIMDLTERLCVAPFLDAGQDVDLDGVDDLYFAYVPLADRTKSRLLVLSGRDGSVIWQRSYSAGPQANGVYTHIVGDLDGDGYHDLVDVGAAFLGTPWHPEYAGHLRAISGRNGDELWEHRLVDYDPYYQPGATKLEVTIGGAQYGPGRFPDINADGVPDLLFTAALDARWLGILPINQIVILSGRDGSPLSMEPIEERLHPFVQGGTSGMNVPNNLGDWDGDGWPELYDSLYSWHASSLVIYGRQTLRLPEEAREGEPVRAQLWIPAGAGKEFQILWSDAFSNAGQTFHAGRWDTHLLDSSLLRESLGRTRARGTLDADGKATLHLRIPRNTGLAGKELYAVAIVHDPSKPDGVLVKSSLAVITILP